MAPRRRRARLKETLDAETLDAETLDAEVTAERGPLVRKKAKQSVEEGVFTSLPAALGVGLALWLEGKNGGSQLGPLLAGGGTTALVKAALWAITGTVAPDRTEMVEERKADKAHRTRVHKHRSREIEEPTDAVAEIGGNGASMEKGLDLQETLRRLEPVEKELLKQVVTLQKYLS
jgi:hypothetical protein